MHGGFAAHLDSVNRAIFGLIVVDQDLQKIINQLEATRASLPDLIHRARETPFDDLALHPDDDVRLEQLLHDLIGCLDSVLGDGNKYSRHLIHIFNSERATFARVASIKCVQRIDAVAVSAIKHIRSNRPQLRIDAEPLALIQRLCGRLHSFVRQIERSGLVEAPFIRDERSLQNLLGALLRLHVDDLRSEEYSPSYAGGSSRIDFLLKTEQLAIEAKIARSGRSDTDIGAELLVDQERYRTHPDCKTLLCVIYDPDEGIQNPNGLKNDLEGLTDPSLRLIVVISPTR